MPKKLAFIAASIVVFAFVFISIAHACSGLTSMNSAIPQSHMNMGAEDPCGTKEPDTCKSVRDRLLSVKPSVSGVDGAEKLGSSSPISFVKLISSSASADSFAKPTFHPVYKLPLIFSYLVLRI